MSSTIIRSGVSRWMCLKPSALRHSSSMPAFLNRETSGVTVEDLSFKQGPSLLPPDVPVQVDGRPFLPGSSKPGLPKYCSPPKPLFPCVFEAQNAAEAEPKVQSWAKALKPVLDEHLAKYRCCSH
ncbi:hypothetical protein CYMTET_52826 [Cymbomonas tetramitiformis]|uniref:Uncharacterized protein n=1 Tax=Cymbomonas tetramitiformis TaxID=36881 RepID=A0AAE0BI73_9CHLO|nr:hypothetical protein CYMTET_52826 [Cymbomonas tetramitiformis]